MDGGVDFQAVADDACVGEQAGAVGVVEGGNGGDVETAIGRLKRGAFFSASASSLNRPG